MKERTLSPLVISISLTLFLTACHEEIEFNFPNGFNDLTPTAPDQIDDLAIWFSSDASAFLALGDGDGISNWPISGGTEPTWSASQNRPPRQPTLSKGAMNGQDAIHFDRNDILIGPPTNAIIRETAGAITAFAVVQFTDPSPGQIFSYKKNASHRSLFSFLVNHTSSPPTTPEEQGALGFSYRNQNDQENLFLTQPSLNDGSPHIVIARWDNSAATEKAELFIDGIGVTASHEDGLFETRGNTGNLTLGARRSGNLHFIGHLGEMGTYTRALSDDEIRQLGLFLALKYNTSWVE